MYGVCIYVQNIHRTMHCLASYLPLSSLPSMSQNTTGHCGPIGQNPSSLQNCCDTDECATSFSS